MIAWLAPVGGLALLAGVPVMVHLLSRRTQRERPFPALRLLQKVVGGRARVSALREKLALLARMLALIAMLIAASAPVWRGTWTSSGAPAVIVLDGSASMHQRSGGTSAWTRGVGVANQLADKLSPRPILLLISGTPLRRSAATADTDNGALRALLTSTSPSWSSGTLDSGIAAGLEALSHGGDLYAITDGSRSALAGVDPSAFPAEIAWHHVVVAGGENNCAIRAVVIEPGTAVVGRPLRVSAEVVNHATRPARLTVRCTIGGQALEQELELAPGTSGALDRSFTPLQAGPLAIEAAIVAGNDDDALAEDDRRNGSIIVAAGRPLRLYTDTDPSDQSACAKPLLAAAAAAGLSTSVRPGAALPGDLTDGDSALLVVTAGLAQADAGGALLEHLRRGGVWLQVTTSDADARLVASGVGGPATPGALVDLSSRSHGLRLGEQHLNHPLSSGLHGREPLLARLEAWRYRPAVPTAGSTVLLAWADGSSALALKPVGPGWWIQLGIGPADGDSTLAALEVLPLIMAHLAEVGGVRKIADAAVACGTSVRGNQATFLASSFLPATESNSLVGSGKIQGTIQGTSGTVRLDLPGTWLVDDKPRAVAIPAAEADLRQTSGNRNPKPGGSGAHENSRTAIGQASDQPLWPWFLLAALALFSVELLLVGGLAGGVVAQSRATASVREVSRPA